MTPTRRSMSSKTLIKIAAPLVALSLVVAACGDDGDDATSSASDTATTDVGSAELASTETGAATLRAGLTDLLTEHVYLAAVATGAALRGDTPAFEANAAALNGPSNSNTSDLIDAISGVYGEEVGTAFDGLWRSEDHIPAFVAYTQAAAADDQAGKDAAVERLTSYATTFGETLNSVNENLPADVVADAITSHATTLLAVIDAQKAGDQPTVYSSLREAYHHMDMTAAALAGGTVALFPDDFDGDVNAPASELRAGLHSLLREHVWLAASATGAASAGRGPQDGAAAAPRDGRERSNAPDLLAAMPSGRGDDVGTAFDGLWRSDDHSPGFVAYAEAAAAGDEAGKAA